MPSWYTRLASNKKALGDITHPSEIKICTKADDFLFDEAYQKNKFSRIKNLLSKLHIQLNSKVALHG